MSKFVGKFRKNKEYNDDYNFASNRRHKNEHSEIKKLLAAHEDERLEENISEDKRFEPSVWYK